MKRFISNCNWKF